MSADEKGPKPFRTEENFGTDSAYGTYCRPLFWRCFGPCLGHRSVQCGCTISEESRFILVVQMSLLLPILC